MTHASASASLINREVRSQSNAKHVRNARSIERTISRLRDRSFDATCDLEWNDVAVRNISDSLIDRNYSYAYIRAILSAITNGRSGRVTNEGANTAKLLRRALLRSQNESLRSVLRNVDPTNRSNASTSSIRETSGCDKAYRCNENDDDSIDTETLRAIRSMKSDGRRIMTEIEYDQLMSFCLDTTARLKRWCYSNETLNGDDPLTANRRSTSVSKGARDMAFLAYVVFMLDATGKRLSDVAELSVCQLAQLRDVGACAVFVKKTRKIGRIELLGGYVEDSTKRTESTARSKSLFERGLSEKSESIGHDRARMLDVYIKCVENKLFDVPFDVVRNRARLDKAFSRVYETTIGKSKPKGLSFHTFRRMFAGRRFVKGQSIESLRKHMDHAVRSQTNAYVNSYLFGSMRYRGDSVRTKRNAF